MSSLALDAALEHQLLSADVQVFTQNMINVGTPDERLRKARQSASPKPITATGRYSPTSGTTPTGACLDEASFLSQFLSADVHAFTQSMAAIGTPEERLRQARQSAQISNRQHEHDFESLF